jgi:hypothetical protein
LQFWHLPRKVISNTDFAVKVPFTNFTHSGICGKIVILYGPSGLSSDGRTSMEGIFLEAVARGGKYK